MMLTSRRVFLLTTAASAGLLATGLYLQAVEQLLPCPLCVIQRMLFWAVGLTALTAFAHNADRLGQRVYAGIVGLFALGGVGVAGYHEWVIHFPEQSTCGINPLELILNELPTARLWPAMFEAIGDCADAGWTLLGLTIPDWALLWFLFFVGMAGHVLLRARAGD